MTAHRPARRQADIPQRPGPKDLRRARERMDLLDAQWAKGEAVYGPYLAPCVCGHGQHAHSGASRQGACGSCGTCRRYRSDLIDVLIQQALTGEGRSLRQALADREKRERAAMTPTLRPEGEWSVRVSDIGGCGRQIGYRNGLAGEVRTNPTRRGQARAGTMVEEYVQALEAEDYPWRQFQRVVQVEGLSSPGRIDMYDPLTARVDDRKSKDGTGYEYVRDNGVDMDHAKQVCVYAAALEEEGERVSSVSITYINRGDLDQTTVYVWPWDDIRRGWAEEARDELIDRQTQLDVAKATGVLPARDRSGPSTDAICRSYCPFRDVCWELPEANRHGRSGESWVRFGESPEDQEVDAVLAEQHAEYAIRRAAEKRISELRALTDGLPIRPYGEYQIAHGREGGPDWKAYNEALVARIERLGHDASDIPVPHYGRARPSVRKVAASKRPGAKLTPTPTPATVEADPLDAGAPVPPEQAPTGQEGAA
jgi:hypothetical protein